MREHHPMRYHRMTEILKTVASVKLSSTFLLKVSFLDKTRLWLGWIPRIFSNFLWRLDIIFSTYYYERTHKNVQKSHEFFRISGIFVNFSSFFEVCCSAFFCAATHSHVIATKRFPLSFYVGCILSGHWETLRENGFIPKTDQKCDFTGVKIA